MLFLFHETTTFSLICDVPLPRCNHHHLEEKKKITVWLSFVMPLCLNTRRREGRRYSGYEEEGAAKTEEKRQR
jgi:hypothetical protein